MEFSIASFFDPSCFPIESPDRWNGFDEGTEFAIASFFVPTSFAIRSPARWSGFYPDINSTGGSTGGGGIILNGRAWIMIAGTWRPILSTDVNVDGTWV